MNLESGGHTGSGSGWFGDPTGRFAQRWYDGANWTYHVVAASGAVVTDPLPEQDRPFAPPPASGRAEPPMQPVQPVQPVQPQWYPPQPSAPPPPASQPAAPQPSAYPYAGARHTAGPDTVRYAPGLGLAVGLIGAVLVALSLFLLKWVDADKGTFLDLSSQVRKAGSDAVNDNSVYLYAAWAGIVLCALTVVLVLVAGLPLPSSAGGNTYARVIGAIVAGGAAVLHTVVIVHIFRGPASPEFGAWLGAAGYLVAVAGMCLGARRREVSAA